jgi:hypothetical protein
VRLHTHIHQQVSIPPLSRLIAFILQPQHKSIIYALRYAHRLLHLGPVKTLSITLVALGCILAGAFALWARLSDSHLTADHLLFNESSSIAMTADDLMLTLPDASPFTRVTYDIAGVLDEPLAPIVCLFKIQVNTDLHIASLNKAFLLVNLPKCLAFFHPKKLFKLFHDFLE